MTNTRDEARRWLEREAQVGRLSDRQTEVARLLAAGKTIEETAAALGIGGDTVKLHAIHIRGRLDLPWPHPPSHPTSPPTRVARRLRPSGGLPAEARGWLDRHPALEMLGTRQRDIVRLLAEGKSVGGVAEALGTTPNAVYSVIAHARTRIGIWERRSTTG